ncbi:MAG: hypothetical protein NTV11_12205 [Rhodocyclales bacterium]|nr:hypothetical protein [Rhodocyclales bacterium]
MKPDWLLPTRIAIVTLGYFLCAWLGHATVARIWPGAFSSIC